MPRYMIRWTETICYQGTITADTKELAEQAFLDNSVDALDDQWYFESSRGGDDDIVLKQLPEKTHGGK